MVKLILFLLLELPKRILSFLVYPLVYPFRHRLRNYDKILWEEYLYEPRIFLLWIFIDDSIEMEFKREYHPDNNRYPNWLWRLAFKWSFCRSFLLSWWWSAIRNSCVNWNNWNAWKLGKFVRVIEWCGTQNLRKVRQDKKGFWFEIREYENGKTRWYLEFFLFKRWNQVGTLNGKSPRFEIDIMKKK